MSRTYNIEPRSAELGGGWDLKLFQNLEEVGGGVFPPVLTLGEPKFDQAHQDALYMAEDWLTHVIP